MSKLEAEKLESQQINEKLQVQQERGMAEKMQVNSSNVFIHIGQFCYDVLLLFMCY